MHKSNSRGAIETTLLDGVEVARDSLVDLRTGDDLLWTQIPPGAKRDLTRFARDGVEDLARNRLQTMREVVGFVDAADDAPWEKGPWDTAVITWEADQAHQEAEAKARAKAEKAAAAKAKREAAAAAKAAAEAA